MKSLPARIGTRYIARRSRTAHVEFELVASAPVSAVGCYRHTMRYTAAVGFAPTEVSPAVGDTFTVEDAWFRERTDIKAVTP